MCAMSLSLAVFGFHRPPRAVEPAGISYEFNLVKDKISLGISTLPVLRLVVPLNGQSAEFDESAGDEFGEFMDKEDHKYHKYMGKLDPNDAKEQDHYRVLGLSKLRFKATSNQIKLAYRQKVLKYHPDKGKSAENGKKRKEELFACIQKAYEQLGDSLEKRRAFDSIDASFDDSIPDAGSVTKENFYEVLAPVYERNARFSNKQPAPLLGDQDSSREHVEIFYEFWYNFNSWREFSYLDSEDKSKGEDRWERREIEKMNKAEREKRRKKETKRITNLVEMTYEKDPRVVLFKEQDRQQKQKHKQQKRDEKERKEREKQVQAEEEEKVREIERLAQAEEDKKANQAKQKKKKVLAAQRKKLRDLSATAQYWSEEEAKQHSIMEQIERICMYCREFEQISALCEKLTDAKIYDDAMEHLSDAAKNCTAEDEDDGDSSNQPMSKSENTSNSSSKWTPDELQLLVKAANLFPAGTGSRWKNVAEYVSNHALGGVPKTEKEVIKQVKSLTSVDANSVSASQIKENGTMMKDSIATTTTPTEKGPADVAEGWSLEQQKQLESALKVVPASDPKRWDNIAAAVDGKTKKECIKRYKELAELVKRGQSKK